MGVNKQVSYKDVADWYEHVLSITHKREMHSNGVLIAALNLDQYINLGELKLNPPSLKVLSENVWRLGNKRSLLDLLKR